MKKELLEKMYATSEGLLLARDALTNVGLVDPDKMRIYADTDCNTLSNAISKTAKKHMSEILTETEQYLQNENARLEKALHEIMTALRY